MHRYIQYTFFFILLILLQVFLFDNLGFGVYVHPLVYVAFILLLPMDTRPVGVLLGGLALGICMDFMTGEAGLNTIASLATAFLRPVVLPLAIGAESTKEGGIPFPGKTGMGKWLRYTIIMVLIHCTVYFCFETLSTRFFHITILRIAINTVITATLIYFSQMLLALTGQDRTT